MSTGGWGEILASLPPKPPESEADKAAHLDRLRAIEAKYRQAPPNATRKQRMAHDLERGTRTRRRVAHQWMARLMHRAEQVTVRRPLELVQQLEQRHADVTEPWPKPDLNLTDPDPGDRRQVEVVALIAAPRPGPVAALV